MLIKTITVGAYETNCYVVADEKTLECAVIDPGSDAAAILDYLEETRLNCRFVLLTHGHFDHTGAVGDILAETEARLFMHKADVGVTIGGDYYRFVPPEGTTYYTDGDTVCVGALSFTVIETPGHTPGSSVSNSSSVSACAFCCSAAPSARQISSGGQGKRSVRLAEAFMRRPRL